MQLTKDDVKTYRDIYYETNKRKNKYLSLSKFQQVVEFYEKYKDHQKGAELLFKEHLEVWERFTKYCVGKGLNQRHKAEQIHPGWVGSYLPSDTYEDWLFSYCFIEGLK